MNKKTPEPKGLFVPLLDSSAIGDGVDLHILPKVQKIVRRLLTRFFAMDFAKVEVSGIIDEPHAKRLKVLIYDGEEIISHIEAESMYPGTVSVRARVGFEIRKAIGKDLVGNVERDWMEALGNEKDFPSSSEAQVSSDGHLSIDVIPFE